MADAAPPSAIESVLVSETGLGRLQVIVRTGGGAFVVDEPALVGGLGSGPTPSSRNTRIIVVNHRDIPAGLLVDEVLGFRRFSDAEFTADVPSTIVQCDRYIAGSFRRGSEQWPVIGLRSLLEDPLFTGAGA